MKTLILLLAISLASSVPIDTESEWKHFKLFHGVHYNTEREENYRRGIFKDNLKRIKEHNELYESGFKTYYAGVTRFSDKTEDEFKAYSGGEKKYPTSDLPYKIFNSSENHFRDCTPPESVDWRDNGAVNVVRDQGECNASYVFAPLAAIESHLFLKTHKMLNLSNQLLVDCLWGCDGGNIMFTYNAINLYGASTEEVYPYTGKQVECDMSKFNHDIRIVGFVRTPPDHVNTIKCVLAEDGPVVTAVDKTGWDIYKGGIFSSTATFSPFGKDYVTVVGYGSENGQDYWIVRNSWGANWGENGYIRVDTISDIGLTKYVTYPLV